MHFELEPLARTLLTSLSRPFDSMNRNRKQMKPKAIQLTKAQQCGIIVESKSATDFKGIEALPKTILDIDDQLLCSDVQTEAEQMYDELQRSFETFQQNINKLPLNVKRKTTIHSRQMTLHNMFKQ